MNNNVNNSHQAGVFKTAPFRKLQTTYPDSNVYPNTPQPSLFSVVRPALNLVQRPRPQGWEVGEGKGGARDFLAVYTPSSCADPSTPAPHRPCPESWAGPSLSCRPWARQLDSRVGGSLWGGGGKAPDGGGRCQASRLLPLPSADNGAPAPPPAPTSGRQAPGPKPAQTAGPTLGLPSFSVPWDPGCR